MWSLGIYHGTLFLFMFEISIIKSLKIFGDTVYLCFIFQNLFYFPVEYRMKSELLSPKFNIKYPFFLVLFPIFPILFPIFLSISLPLCTLTSQTDVFCLSVIYFYIPVVLPLRIFIEIFSCFCFSGLNPGPHA